MLVSTRSKTDFSMGCAHPATQPLISTTHPPPSIRESPQRVPVAVKTNGADYAGLRSRSCEVAPACPLAVAHPTLGEARHLDAIGKQTPAAGPNRTALWFLCMHRIADCIREDTESRSRLTVCDRSARPHGPSLGGDRRGSNPRPSEPQSV